LRPGRDGPAGRGHIPRGPDCGRGTVRAPAVAPSSRVPPVGSVRRSVWVGRGHSP